MNKENNLENNVFNQFQNGIVTNVLKTNYKGFGLFPDNNNNNNSFKNTALKGIQEDSTLSFLFFSEDNMNIVQENLRYLIWIQSGKKYLIDKQSTIQLEIVMRSIFLQYAVNLNCKFTEQIKKLNDLVIDYCIPNILAQIQSYLGYIDSLEVLPMPMGLPQNLSSAGSKTLKSVTTTF